MQPDQPAAQKPSMIKINPDDVHFVASLVHGFENAPTFIFESRVYPFRRGPYDAWVFQYPDGSRCAVQVPIHMQNRPRTETESLIEHEVANLEKLAQAQFAWSPRPISYSATFANHLRYPYIITTWIDGRPLEWTDTVPEIPQRGLVLQQLAGILFELVQCTLQPESGASHRACLYFVLSMLILLIFFWIDPSITADRFLRDKIDKKMMQVIRNQTKELTIPDCMALRLLARQISIIPSEIYPNNDPNVPNEPCAVAASALAHDDLCASNILIDDNYRITGSLCTKSRSKRSKVR